MAFSKVILNGTTLMDVTGTTAVESDVNYSKVFTKANGVQASGTNTSATAHTIYFEFTDETDTTITAYYDGTFISDAITATVPKTYNNKTVSLAQLDNVTWYEFSNIPLNTELVDYNTITTGYKLNDNGAIIEGESWDCVTDYISIDPSMTFTGICRDWTRVGVYGSNKNVIATVSSHDIGTTAEDSFIHFTIDPSSIPPNAAYIILVGNVYDIEGSLSLIRTA